MIGDSTHLRGLRNNGFLFKQLSGVSVSTAFFGRVFRKESTSPMTSGERTWRTFLPKQKINLTFFRVLGCEKMEAEIMAGLVDGCFWVGGGAGP